MTRPRARTARRGMVSDAEIRLRGLLPVSGRPYSGTAQAGQRGLMSVSRSEVRDRAAAFVDERRNAAYATGRMESAYHRSV